MRRSASPSRAKPTSAPRATTSAASDAGARRRDDLRRDDPARPVRAVEDDLHAGGLDRAGQTQPVGTIAVEQVTGITRDPELGIADPTQLLDTPDELLELVLDGVI